MQQGLFPLSIFTATILASSLSQAAITVPVTLKQATVFTNGAELQSRGEFTIPAGESELLLTGFAGQPDPQTITLKVSQGVTIVSTQFQTDYASKQPESAILKSFLDEMDRLKAEQDKRNIHLQVLDEEIGLLKANRKRFESGHFSLSVKEASETIRWVTTRLPEVLAEKVIAEETIKKAGEEIDRLQRQIDDEKQNGQYENAPSYAMLLKVSSAQEITSPIEMNYVVYQAGWTPRYDLRVDDLKAPLTLVYRAQVFQQTGVDWRNVMLTLSTSNPYQGTYIPELFPWTVDIYQKPLLKTSQANRVNTAMVQDMAMAEAGSAPSNNEVLYSTQASAKLVQTNTDGHDVKFDVQVPQTLPSHRQGQNIVLKEEKIPVQYGYITVPKLNPRAFLQAKVSDWEKLNLLPGATSIYLTGNYVGSGMISTDEITDTLNLSLGEDKSVLVNRKRDQHVTSRPAFLGNSIQQRFAYTIEVKNTRQEEIEIEVKDQLPVIANAAITLTDAEYGNAEYDKEKGELTWKLKIKPNEVATLPFSFSLKYPKDQRLTGL